jgi:sensor histidine kinase YesM
MDEQIGYKKSFIPHLKKMNTKFILLRIFGIFIIVNLIIILLCIAFTVLNTKEFKKEINSYLIKEQVKTAATKIKEYFDNIDKFITIAYPEFQSQNQNDNKSQEKLKQSKIIINTLFKMNKDISGVTFFTHDRKIIPYININSPYDFIQSTTQLYNELNVYDGISDIILQKGEYLQYIRYFEDEKTKSNDIMVVEINLGMIEKYMNELYLPLEGNLLVLNNFNDVLFSTNANEVPFTDKNILNNLNESSGMTGRLKINGADMYIFYDKSALHSCNVLFLVSAEFLDNSDNTANYLMILSIITFGIILAGNILYFYRGIYKPLILCEGVLIEITEGNLENKIYKYPSGNLYHSIFDNLSFIQNKMNTLINSEYSSKILLKQAELDALQSQINPHFLYNTLETIRGQAISFGAQDIEQMISALAELFRYSIIDKGSMIKLEEEIKNVNNYLLIQKYRFGSKFTVDVQIDEDTFNHKVPKLLLQPLVENAFQHGLEIKTGKGTVVIKSYRTQNRLIIQVFDNGIGIEKEKLDEINQYLDKDKDFRMNKFTLRIGLLNVNERIKLNFGNEYGIKLYSTKDSGTMVEVTLPLLS